MKSINKLLLLLLKYWGGHLW